MRGRYTMVCTMIFMFGCISNQCPSGIPNKSCTCDDESKGTDELKGMIMTEVFEGSGEDSKNKGATVYSNNNCHAEVGEVSGEVSGDDFGEEVTKWCSLPPDVWCHCAHIEGCKAEPIDCCQNDPHTCPIIGDDEDDSSFIYWEFMPLEVSLLDQSYKIPHPWGGNVYFYTVPGCDYVPPSGDYLLVVSYNASKGVKCSCGEAFVCPFYGDFLLVHLISIKDKKAYLILRYLLNGVVPESFPYWYVPWSPEPYCNPNFFICDYPISEWCTPPCRMTIPQSFFIEGIGLVKYDYSLGDDSPCGFEDPVHNVLWINGEEVPLPLN